MMNSKKLLFVSLIFSTFPLIVCNAVSKITYSVKPCISKIFTITAWSENKEELALAYFQQSTPTRGFINRILQYCGTPRNVTYDLFHEIVNRLQKDGCTEVGIEVQRNDVPSTFFEDLGIQKEGGEWGGFIKRGIYFIKNTK